MKRKYDESEGYDSQEGAGIFCRTVQACSLYLVRKEIV